MKDKCFCGWAYQGRKCRELQKIYPHLKWPFWHHSENASQPSEGK